jgi:hypothetical protein
MEELKALAGPGKEFWTAAAFGSKTLSSPLVVTRLIGSNGGKTA